jgi:hypothetical protein
MKTKIFILSSLISVCSAMSAYASDCIGNDCEIEKLNIAEVDVVEYAEVVPTQTQNNKIITVTEVQTETRPPLWDGVHGEYNARISDKTVDWRDGVPIWDDSINSYKYKDFSDWFVDAKPQLRTEHIIVEQPKAETTVIATEIEELLTPQKPSDDLWMTHAPRSEYIAQDMTDIINAVFGESDDGCPFETDAECEIWRKKPIVRETVAPRSKKLRNLNMAEFVGVAACNTNISATHPVAAPLLDRYKLLMRSAQACCTDGMVYSLKQAGASDGLVYKFMSDDANFYGFGARCLMMTDHELDTKYPNTATASVAADVRNGCLCRGRQWFSAMLAPFQQAYDTLPEFKNAPFMYTYTDGLQREITVSVNNDVQNVLRQLAQCP